MLTRILSIIGIFFLLLALLGFLLLITKSFPRELLSSELQAGSLAIPTEPPEPGPPTEEPLPPTEESAAPFGGEAPTLFISPASDALPGGELLLSGTGDPDFDVEIVVDGEVVAQAPVNNDGNWALSLSLAEPGEYEIIAQAVDARGLVLAESESATISIAVIPTATASPVPGPTSTPGAPTSTPTAAAISPDSLPVTGSEAAQPPPTVVIQAEWPQEIAVDSQDIKETFKVSLIQLANGDIIPTVEKVEKRSVITATAIPIARDIPGIPPTENAFGPEYEGYVTARLTDYNEILDAELHDTIKARQSLKQLEQSPIEWIWVITPKKQGVALLIVEIEADWVPTNGSEDAKKGPYLVWRKEFRNIKVTEPFLRGLNLPNVIASALIGSLFNVPLLFQLGRKMVRIPQLDSEASYKRTLATLHGNLARLEETAAQYGLDVPTKVANEIETTKAKIAEIEAKLSALQAASQDS